MSKRSRNSFFQCEQFRIEQTGAAMKVTTDACVLGAWVDCSQAQRILDIGTGTGVLSLFCAQRSLDSCQIDAVELDQNAACQAAVNFAHSPWSERLNAIQADIRSFSTETPYDLIISNPPFFSASTRNAQTALAQARHDITLPLAELLDAIATLLAPQGEAYLLLPAETAQETCALATSIPLYAEISLNIVSQLGALPHCAIVRITHRNRATAKPADTLVLYHQHPLHTAEAARLFYPYYTQLRCEDATLVKSPHQKMAAES